MLFYEDYELDSCHFASHIWKTIPKKFMCSTGQVCFDMVNAGSYLSS